MSAFAGYLSLTLVVGAAHADSDAATRKRLADAVLPLTHELRDKSTSPARAHQLVRLILDKILAIKGENWEMPEDYKAQILVLLDKR